MHRRGTRVIFVLTILVGLGATELPAQKLLPDALQDLASQIASKVQQEETRRIAVVNGIECSANQFGLRITTPHENPPTTRCSRSRSWIAVRAAR